MLMRAEIVDEDKVAALLSIAVTAEPSNMRMVPVP